MYSTAYNLWTFTWFVHFELPFRLKKFIPRDSFNSSLFILFSMGISYTCYPYTPILILLPPKIQTYPTSWADIVELRNCFILWNLSQNFLREIIICIIGVHFLGGTSKSPWMQLRQGSLLNFFLNYCRHWYM